MANDIDPAAFNAVRFWIAALLIGAFALARGGFSPGALSAPWRYAVLGGLFGFYFVMMFEGLKTAPPVSTAAMFTLVPFMSAGFAFLLMRQHLTAKMALALGIGAIGAVWVIFRADLSALLRFDLGRGEAIFFIGCISHALYTPMVRRLNRGETAVTFAFGTSLAGGALLTVYAWPLLQDVDWAALPARVWLTLAYTAFFATAVTVVLIQFATLRLPSAKVMAYTYLTPSWVILWEVTLGGHLPGALVLLGVALTASALMMLLRDEQPR